MNNTLKKISLFICASLIFTSCDSVDFGDTNENPNGPTAAVTSQLLTQAQKTVSSIGTNLSGILFTQQLAEGQYPGESRYAVLTYNYNSYFTGPIQNLNEIIKLNQGAETMAQAEAFGNNNNQIAVAKIIRAYILQFMTDRWGALPWTEAFQGIDNPQPKFDSQQDIYMIMFAEVEEALALINSGAGPSGDVIFGGDMAKWELFANSLKMTMALRISDADPALAKTKFEQVISSGNFISSNADNILFNYGSDDASDSPWHDRFKTREDYVLSETLVNTLTSMSDPRLPKYGEPSRTGVLGVYVGAENGKVNGNVPDYSFPTGTIIYNETYPTPIYTAAQMKFAMAEAKMKGWNVGASSPAELFTQGIEASMTYWGVDSADIATYTASHTYGNINDIAYEKWIALYLNGPEAWAEWRRLDSPALTPSIYAGDQRIPVRHAYDSSVEDNNKANYDATVASQGQDDLHTKLWWDKN